MLKADAKFYENDELILELEFELDDSEDLETFELQLEAQYPNSNVVLFYSKEIS